MSGKWAGANMADKLRQSTGSKTSGATSPTPDAAVAPTAVSTQPAAPAPEPVATPASTASAAPVVAQDGHAATEPQRPTADKGEPASLKGSSAASTAAAKPSELPNEAAAPQRESTPSAAPAAVPATTAVSPTKSQQQPQSSGQPPVAARTVQQPTHPQPQRGQVAVEAVVDEGVVPAEGDVVTFSPELQQLLVRNSITLVSAPPPAVPPPAYAPQPSRPATHTASSRGSYYPPMSAPDAQFQQGGYTGGYASYGYGNYGPPYPQHHHHHQPYYGHAPTIPYGAQQNTRRGGYNPAAPPYNAGYQRARGGHAAGEYNP